MFHFSYFDCQSVTWSPRGETWKSIAVLGGWASQKLQNNVLESLVKENTCFPNKDMKVKQHDTTCSGFAWMALNKYKHERKYIRRWISLNTLHFQTCGNSVILVMQHLHLEGFIPFGSVETASPKMEISHLPRKTGVRRKIIDSKSAFKNWDMLVPRRVTSNSHPMYHSTGLRLWGNYLPVSFELADSQQSLIMNKFEYVWQYSLQVSSQPLSDDHTLPCLQIANITPNTCYMLILPCPNMPKYAKWSMTIETPQVFTYIFSASGFYFDWPYFCDPTNLKATAGNSNHFTPMRVWQVKGKPEEDSPWLRKKLLVMLSFFSFSSTSTQKRYLKVTVTKVFVHSHLMLKELIKAHFSRCDFQDKEGHDVCHFRFPHWLKKTGETEKMYTVAISNVRPAAPHLWQHR